MTTDERDTLREWIAEQLAILFIDFGHAESQWQFMNDEKEWPRPDAHDFAEKALALLDSLVGESEPDA